MPTFALVTLAGAVISSGAEILLLWTLGPEEQPLIKKLTNNNPMTTKLLGATEVSARFEPVFRPLRRTLEKQLLVSMTYPSNRVHDLPVPNEQSHH